MRRYLPSLKRVAATKRASLQTVSNVACPGKIACAYCVIRTRYGGKEQHKKGVMHAELMVGVRVQALIPDAAPGCALWQRCMEHYRRLLNRGPLHTSRNMT